MNQQDLNLYFSTYWKSNLDLYKFSGWELINKIKPTELVLDVGCGFNEFKLHIPNLIGIDPANSNADYQITIEEFTTDVKFDVAFCLGSINFGNEATILNQIRCVVNLLNPKSRIYWRCNPGIADHNNKECTGIDFYNWSIDNHLEFSTMFGYKLDTVTWDKGKRIYAEWNRTG